MSDIHPSYSAITALYERFLDILERKDFEQFQEVVTPDFRYTENGHELTLQQLIEREQQARKVNPNQRSTHRFKTSRSKTTQHCLRLTEISKQKLR